MQGLFNSSTHKITGAKAPQPLPLILSRSHHQRPFKSPSILSLQLYFPPCPWLSLPRRPLSLKSCPSHQRPLTASTQGTQPMAKGKGQHHEVETEEEMAIKEEPDLVATTYLRQLELRLHLLLRYPLLPLSTSPSPATSLITFSSSPLILFANASYLGPSFVDRSF